MLILNPIVCVLEELSLKFDLLSSDYGEYRIHLQQLREVSRGNTRDYWQINWGDDESRYKINAFETYKIA
jgi:hypothetical protein